MGQRKSSTRKPKMSSIYEKSNLLNMRPSTHHRRNSHRNPPYRFRGMALEFCPPGTGQDFGFPMKSPTAGNYPQDGSLVEWPIKRLLSKHEVLPELDRTSTQKMLNMGINQTPLHTGRKRHRGATSMWKHETPTTQPCKEAFQNQVSKEYKINYANCDSSLPHDVQKSQANTAAVVSSQPQYINGITRIKSFYPARCETCENCGLQFVVQGVSSGEDDGTHAQRSRKEAHSANFVEIIKNEIAPMLQRTSAPVCKRTSLSDFHPSNTISVSEDYDAVSITDVSQVARSPDFGRSPSRPCSKSQWSSSSPRNQKKYPLKPNLKLAKKIHSPLSYTSQRSSSPKNKSKFSEVVPSPSRTLSPLACTPQFSPSPSHPMIFPRRCTPSQLRRRSRIRSPRLLWVRSPRRNARKHPRVLRLEPALEDRRRLPSPNIRLSPSRIRKRPHCPEPVVRGRIFPALIKHPRSPRKRSSTTKPTAMAREPSPNPQVGIPVQKDIPSKCFVWYKKIMEGEPKKIQRRKLQRYKPQSMITPNQYSKCYEWYSKIAGRGTDSGTKERSETASKSSKYSPSSSKSSRKKTPRKKSKPKLVPRRSAKRVEPPRRRNSSRSKSPRTSQERTSKSKIKENIIKSPQSPRRPSSSRMAKSRKPSQPLKSTEPSSTTIPQPTSTKKKKKKPRPKLVLRRRVMRVGAPRRINLRRRRSPASSRPTSTPTRSRISSRAKRDQISDKSNMKRLTLNPFSWFRSDEKRQRSPLTQLITNSRSRLSSMSSYKVSKLATVQPSPNLDGKPVMELEVRRDSPRGVRSAAGVGVRPKPSTQRRVTRAQMLRDEFIRKKIHSIKTSDDSWWMNFNSTMLPKARREYGPWCGGIVEF